MSTIHAARSLDEWKQEVSKVTNGSPLWKKICEGHLNAMQQTAKTAKLAKSKPVILESVVTHVGGNLRSSNKYVAADDLSTAFHSAFDRLQNSSKQNTDGIFSKGSARKSAPARRPVQQQRSARQQYSDMDPQYQGMMQDAYQQENGRRYMGSDGQPHMHFFSWIMLNLHKIPYLLRHGRWPTEQMLDNEDQQYGVSQAYPGPPDHPPPSYFELDEQKQGEVEAVYYKEKKILPFRIVDGVKQMATEFVEWLVKVEDKIVYLFFHGKWPSDYELRRQNTTTSQASVVDLKADIAAHPSGAKKNGNKKENTTKQGKHERKLTKKLGCDECAEAKTHHCAVCNAASHAGLANIVNVPYRDPKCHWAGAHYHRCEACVNCNGKGTCKPGPPPKGAKHIKPSKAGIEVSQAIVDLVKPGKNGKVRECKICLKHGHKCEWDHKGKHHVCPSCILSRKTQGHAKGCCPGKAGKFTPEGTELLKKRRQVTKAGIDEDPDDNVAPLTTSAYQNATADECKRLYNVSKYDTISTLKTFDDIVEKHKSIPSMAKICQDHVNLMDRTKMFADLPAPSVYGHVHVDQAHKHEGNASKLLTSLLNHIEDDKVTQKMLNELSNEEEVTVQVPKKADTADAILPFNDGY